MKKGLRKKEEKKKKYLSKEEVAKLMPEVKAGNQVAWEIFYKNFEDYVKKRAKIQLDRIDESEMSSGRKETVVKDLAMAGWRGVISAVQNYESDKGNGFLTYATSYIDGKIWEALQWERNPLGLTKRPKTDKSGIVWLLLNEEVYKETDKPAWDVEYPDLGKYSADRLALQIIDILRHTTDENHSLSKEELGECLNVYYGLKYKNGHKVSANTITKTLQGILTELDPMEWSEENDSEYRIRYKGYKKNRLKEKLNGRTGRKEITDFSFIHLFNEKELNRIIPVICFSDLLSEEDKTNLIGKLIKSSSHRYKTPYWDGKKLKFNKGAVVSRRNGNQIQEGSAEFSHKLDIIQQTMNSFGKIRFRFNSYTHSHKMMPKSEYVHELTPYHLVVYHDNYYCIGLKSDGEEKRIWHFRVDLMSDIEPVYNKDGGLVKGEVAPFEGLPILNKNWDPEKYMAEHLYMGYDTPREIHIKIRKDDYTIIHDWFGDYYERTDNPCDEGYDIVRVRTSPFMIRHWAMQYGTNVEIMDKDIREEIRKELKEMLERYRETEI